MEPNVHSDEVEAVTVHIWRRWVFPILLVLVFGAIAASLVKLAFFAEEVTLAEQPGAVLNEAVVSVEKGTVESALQLSGTVTRDEAYPLRSTADGTVSAVHVSEGQKVAKGQALVTIKQSFPVKNVDIVAAEAGTVSGLTVVTGQGVTIGGDLTTLNPERYHIVSPVKPVQLYRLVAAPSEASVTITGGPAPFTCTGLSVQVANDGTSTVNCAVPADQVVFSGLPATLDIALGMASDVLVIPATAVKGGSGSGVVWLDAGNGEFEERSVTLGVSDGELVEVTEGLSEGEMIRQFVPGVVASNEPACYDDGTGGEFCEISEGSW